MLTYQNVAAVGMMTFLAGHAEDGENFLQRRSMMSIDQILNQAQIENARRTWEFFARLDALKDEEQKLRESIRRRNRKAKDQIERECDGAQSSQEIHKNVS